MAGYFDIENDTLSAKLILPDGDVAEIKKVERERLARGWKIKAGGEVYITDRVVWKSGEGYLCVIHLIDLSTWNVEVAKRKKLHRLQHILWFAFGVALTVFILWWNGRV